MKSLASRTIFHCAISSSTSSPSPYFLSSHCLCFYSSFIEDPQNKRRGTSHPSSSSSSSSYSSWRHHDEESRNVKVSVWWDFENCSPPAGANVSRVAQRITSALRVNGIKGPVTITAFGDVSQLSRSNQEALSSTGICLNHIPHGGKNSADRSLLVDLVYWVSQNPPPAHLFLISGDRDFANIFHRLRMNNYNILLASTESAPGVLCSAASIMWHWNALVRGDSLTGKHFNQPPDGPYGSWYGHYKGPLEDPFSDMEQPACFQPEDLTEPGTDSKFHPVPKAFLSRIRKILNLYPKGINITELRSELARNNVTIDKDFFGYKKFSRLLLSMPTILKLRPAGDGMILVHAIHPKAAEPVESNLKVSTVPETKKEDQDHIVTVKENGGDSSVAAVESNLKVSTVPETKKEVQDHIVTVKENGGDSSVAADVNGKSSSPLPAPPTPALKVEEAPPLGHKEIDAHTTVGHLTNVEEQDSTYEMGFLQKICRKWFGCKYGDSKEKGTTIPEKCSAAFDNSMQTKSEEFFLESTPYCPDPLSSSNVTKSVLDEKISTGSGDNGEKSIPTTGLLNTIVNWCRFWRTSPNPDKASGQCGKEVNQKSSQSENRELFLKDFSWDDLDLFVHTPKGSVLISQSRTREQMAQKLQKEGPMILNNLSEGDLLHLVDLLISEKKWVVEHPSRTFPFKLSRHARRSSSHPLGSNRLSSLFMGKLSQSNFQGLPENQMDKGDQNLSQPGACLEEGNKKPSSKSRHEILADCQKLVAEILVEHPDVYNMGSFKKLFVERYGYVLDYQILGYQNLATMLQMLPGVKIESTYILSSRNASQNSVSETALPYSLGSNDTGEISNSDNELSDTARKDNDRDSVWEELGPIFKTSSKRNDPESALNRETKKETVERVDFGDYHLLDEEFSDSEGEDLTLDQLEGQEKSRKNEENSSLLQVLDSWYDSKDDNGSNDQSHKKCSGTGPKPARVGTKSSPLVTNSRRKLKPLKNFSIVSDPVVDDKEKLIANILGSLKKSAETKMPG